MANLQETSTWEAGIYQLETSDPVMGGENGIDNRAPRQLANRTLWLKNELARQIGLVNNGKLGKTENAATATKLQTARNIAMTGDGTGQANFDGSANANIALTLANSGVTAGSYNSVTVDAKGRVTAGLTQTHGLVTATTATGTANQATTNTNTYLNIVASGVGQTASVGSSTQITGTNGITVSSDTAGKLIVGQTLANSLTDTSTDKALTANMGKALKDELDTTVKLTGNQTITGRKTFGGEITVSPASSDNSLIMGVGSGDIYIKNTVANKFLQFKNDGTLAISNDKVWLYSDRSDAVNLDRTDKVATAKAVKSLNDTKLGKTENAVSATKLQTARNIAMTGDGSWSVNFDGSANASGAFTLANSGVTAGSYNSVTVDAKGRVTAGLTQTHGLVTATTATGTANQATTNTNTYLNIVASGVGSTASVGSSTQVTGTNGISISSDTAGKLIISRDSNSPTATKLQTARTINGVAFDGTQNITIYDNTKLASNANAVSASRLATARTISLTGAVTGSVSFNGSENVSIATTLNLADFANSKTENGYQKLPNGLIIQWGKLSSDRYLGESAKSITFPIAFPTTCLNVQASMYMVRHSALGDGGVFVVDFDRSTANFSLQSIGTNSVWDLRGFYWFAIGY